MTRASPANSSSTLAEIQGLYGTFSFPEKLLQKIWLRGDFNRAAAQTSTGRRVRIVHPGKWNLLGGPDFQSARLRFDDGPEITGDIELHLRAGDWEAHGHARDPAYSRVVLHVVLFPPGIGRITHGANGREIPVLALLPLLHHDLEEFAAEDAVEALANRAARRIPDELGRLGAAELRGLLVRHAGERWRQKVHFARMRVQRLGWTSACHHTALEILGYRFNRAPMLRIAGQWPLAAWAEHRVTVEELYAAEAEGWSLQGVRPANHPRTRLRQYMEWVQARPDWPERMVMLCGTVPPGDPVANTREVRHALGLTALRVRVAAAVCATSIRGTRLDNMVCDGWLPLLAAQTTCGVQPLWFHWFAGDVPPVVSSGLRQLGILERRTQPACHGIAQGLLGWLIEREAAGRGA
ncbi:MAG: DUF2851 family protein [Opitutus sp.]